MTSPRFPSSAEVPIACTLSAADLRQRRRDVANLAAGALVSRSPIAEGERLVFGAAGDTAQRLEQLVAAEADCCPSLNLTLRPEGDRLILDVTGPAGTRPIVEELFA